MVSALWRVTPGLRNASRGRSARVLVSSLRESLPPAGASISASISAPAPGVEGQLGHDAPADRGGEQVAAGLEAQPPERVEPSRSSSTFSQSRLRFPALASMSAAPRPAAVNASVSVRRPAGRRFGGRGDPQRRRVPVGRLRRSEDGPRQLVGARSNASAKSAANCAFTSDVRMTRSSSATLTFRPASCVAAVSGFAAATEVSQVGGVVVVARDRRLGCRRSVRGRPGRCLAGSRRGSPSRPRRRPGTGCSPVPRPLPGRYRTPVRRPARGSGSAGIRSRSLGLSRPGPRVRTTSPPSPIVTSQPEQDRRRSRPSDTLSQWNRG